jgi:hypothetical protein
MCAPEFACERAAIRGRPGRHRCDDRAAAWHVARGTIRPHPATQPRSATAVRRLLDGTRDRAAAGARVASLYPGLRAWHRWWSARATPRAPALTTTLQRVEPSLFSALRTGFEGAVCNDDAPIRPQLLSRLRPALADAAATAPRGRPILVRLDSIAELYPLGDCFAVGGEGHPRVTDAQWDAITTR